MLESWDNGDGKGVGNFPVSAMVVSPGDGDDGAELFSEMMDEGREPYDGLDGIPALSRILSRAVKDVTEVEDPASPFG